MTPETSNQATRATFWHDGIEIPYEVRGAGEPIVLIHGGIGRIEVWERVAGELARTHRIFAYDQRGHGSSTAEGTPDLRVHRDDLAAFMEQVVGGAATLVAWSGGGGVGLPLALDRPELVTHLILMEGAFYLRIPNWEALKAMLRFRRVIRKRPDDAVTDFMRLMFAYRTGMTAWDEISEEDRQLFLGDARGLESKLRLHRYAGHMEWLKARDVAECPVPMTWIGGEESIEFFQKMHGKLAAANSKLKTVMIPGENHAFPVVDPTAFAGVVRELAREAAPTS